MSTWADFILHLRYFSVALRSWTSKLFKCILRRAWLPRQSNWRRTHWGMSRELHHDSDFQIAFLIWNYFPQVWIIVLLVQTIFIAFNVWSCIFQVRTLNIPYLNILFIWGQSQRRNIKLVNFLLLIVKRELGYGICVPKRNEILRALILLNDFIRIQLLLAF